MKCPFCHTDKYIKYTVDEYECYECGLTGELNLEEFLELEQRDLNLNFWRFFECLITFIFIIFFCIRLYYIIIPDTKTGIQKCPQIQTFSSKKQSSKHQN